MLQHKHRLSAFELIKARLGHIPWSVEGHWNITLDSRISGSEGYFAGMHVMQLGRQRHWSMSNEGPWATVGHSSLKE